MYKPYAAPPPDDKGMRPGPGGTKKTRMMGLYGKRITQGMVGQNGGVGQMKKLGKKVKIGNHFAQMDPFQESNYV